MKEVDQREAVGVIIGRFQVPTLTDAHRSLFDHVVELHDKVIVFLGVSPLFVTEEDPLDYESRRQMISEAYPDLNLLYIKDRATDQAWSRSLDNKIVDLCHPGQDAVLYGGRESFIEHYTGKVHTRELIPESWMSGSEIRRQVSRAKAKASADWRAGVVWASGARFPTSYTTIDVLPFIDDHNVVLVRKPDEPKFRLIGGFTDPKCETLEEDVARESWEEASVTFSEEPHYVGSAKVDDWRYRKGKDKIKTTIWVARANTGDFIPNDPEIAEAKIFLYKDIVPKRDIMPAHHPLLERINQRISVGLRYRDVF